MIPMVPATQGLPGEFILLFTLLIWTLFILILLSNPRNKLNQWCFFSGMLFSMGVLKEYLFFTLAPTLTGRFPQLLSPGFPETVYSVLTAVLYYFAMPAVMVFSLYFCHLDARKPALFRWLRLLVFLPCLVYAVFFPYGATRFYQLYVPSYYISVAVYNWIYGLVSTTLILCTLRRERMSFQYRQRKMVAVVVLLPIWYWLVSAFPIHILGLSRYFKVWQGNVVIILVLLVYYLYNAFRGGIWGIRLRQERYDWTDSSRAVQKNAQYVGHALKNELSKIEWCVNILGSRGEIAGASELGIISRSAEHLKQFVDRTKVFADDIVLRPAAVDVRALFEECAAGISGSSGKEISVKICCDPEPLWCDREHFAEVLNNLLHNAVDAISGRGTVRLLYRACPGKRRAVVEVRDTGCGIAKEKIPSLFDPYYSTKAAGQHLGLGLFYCYNVMNRHRGSIQVKSEPGRGSSFLLYFPMQKQKRRGEVQHGKKDKRSHR